MRWLACDRLRERAAGRAAEMGRGGDRTMGGEDRLMLEFQTHREHARLTLANVAAMREPSFVAPHFPAGATPRDVPTAQPARVRIARRGFKRDARRTT